MIFSHDTEHSLTEVVGLVNTGPTRADGELLSDISDLERFVKEHEISGVSALSGDDLAEAHEVRRKLDTAFELHDAIDAADYINGLVATVRVAPRLTDHDGHSWHLHYHPRDASLADHLLVDGCMALSQVVISEHLDRLRTCDVPTCNHVLVDLSRNRSKRYCDARTCGNRLHVAAYRERQRASADG